MKLFAAVLTALTCVSIVHAIPVENNVAVDCPVDPEHGRPIEVSLCADKNYEGYCRQIDHCAGACYDLVDYGVLQAYGKGVSSASFPITQQCMFFSGRRCDDNFPYVGTFQSQTDFSNIVNGIVTPEHAGLNDKIVSFKCGNNPGTVRVLESTPQVIEKREEVVPEVVDVLSEVAKREGKPPFPNSNGHFESVWRSSTRRPPEVTLQSFEHTQLTLLYLRPPQQSPSQTLFHLYLTQTQTTTATRQLSGYFLAYVTEVQPRHISKPPRLFSSTLKSNVSSTARTIAKDQMLS